MTVNNLEIQSDFSTIEFILKSYIQRNIKGVHPKYSYPGESGINPAFQRIEDVDKNLRQDEKRIFALRSDFILATGVKNSEQQFGYQGLRETFHDSQFSYLNRENRYGHPSLTIAGDNNRVSVFYAGHICQRAKFLEVFLSSGRFNRCNRVDEGILPLTEEQTTVIEAYLALKFERAYGCRNVLFYDTTPEEDEVDSKVFFTNKPISKHKNVRIYNQLTINKAITIASLDSRYIDAQRYIRETILPVKPGYTYSGEGSINPGYQDITTIHYPLLLQEKRIWVLRSDFILATGIKNAYQAEHNYFGLKDSFSQSLYKYLNWDDRSGHPSLTLAEGHYDGSAFYAGYVCQRKGYLQVYLVSGRFERTDLTEEQTCILEAYIAAQFLVAYGNQEIVFDYGNSEIPSYHATFFRGGVFDKSNPQRRYNPLLIQSILQNIPDLSVENIPKINSRL